MIKTIFSSIAFADSALHESHKIQLWSIWVTPDIFKRQFSSYTLKWLFWISDHRQQKGKLAIWSEDADTTFPIIYCPSKTKENGNIGARQKSCGIGYGYFPLIVFIFRRPKEKQRIKQDECFLRSVYTLSSLDWAQIARMSQSLAIFYRIKPPITRKYHRSTRSNQDDSNNTKWNLFCYHPILKKRFVPGSK